MTVFTETKTTCFRCDKKLSYFGLPEAFMSIKHQIYPYCEKCAGELKKLADKKLDHE